MTGNGKRSSLDGWRCYVQMFCDYFGITMTTVAQLVEMLKGKRINSNSVSRWLTLSNWSHARTSHRMPRPDGSKRQQFITLWMKGESYNPFTIWAIDFAAKMLSKIVPENKIELKTMFKGSI